jgi:hypothetical protein
VGVGGALETVLDGKTGRLWQGGPAELADAVLSFDASSVDPADCVRSAARFDRAVFRGRLPQEIERVLDTRPAATPAGVHRGPHRPPARGGVFTRRPAAGRPRRG